MYTTHKPGSLQTPNSRQTFRHHNFFHYRRIPLQYSAVKGLGSVLLCDNHCDLHLAFYPRLHIATSIAPNSGAHSLTSLKGHWLTATSTILLLHHCFRPVHCIIFAQTCMNNALTFMILLARHEIKQESLTLIHLTELDTRVGSINEREEILLF